MSYPKLIERLFKVNLHGGMKLGLANCQQLQRILNYPDRTFQSIHVAGTNGKGSVTTKIAGALQAAGYRVGLYTSPHIASFRERIRINGEMISEDAVEELLTQLFALVEKERIPATFFEITTLLAFLHFAKNNVDFAVLETGLGGRLDATNIVSPILSVITSIGLDHTEILGDTLEAIAREKAGIIKPGIPVVIGPQVPEGLMLTYAKNNKSPLTQVKGTYATYELENRAVAQGALKELAKHISIPAEALRIGLAARQPCRFEVLEGPPQVVIDVAHNPDGLTRLFEAVKAHFPERRLQILFGLSKSKDIESCLKILAAHGSHFHLVAAPNGRGAAIQELSEGLRRQGIEESRILQDEDIHRATLRALADAKQKNNLVVICGTFFIMGAARQALGIREAHDAIDVNERSASHLSLSLSTSNHIGN